MHKKKYYRKKELLEKYINFSKNYIFTTSNHTLNVGYEDLPLVSLSANKYGVLEIESEV